MKNAKQIRAAIRKIIRKAKQDQFTLITVAGSDNDSQLERDLIRAILDCDETTVCFYNNTTGTCLGVILFVFDYDSEPDEIVCDCTDNAYTRNLIKTESN
tara:strand:+ start:401 stop:700 length:300 start_codon:yes stop_codon:yes gene_type:complete